MAIGQARPHGSGGQLSGSNPDLSTLFCLVK